MQLFFYCCCQLLHFFGIGQTVASSGIFSTIGNDLNELKDKAKKANSAYKWIKENWKKIFVIIVAIFALIVVVGIYRRCFSDSG